MTSNRTLLALVFAVAMVVTPAAGVAGASTASTTPLEGCDYSLTVTDATGEAVTVEESPERVVTLGPASAQTMWEFGAQDKVVGTTPDASYLEGADAKTNVSGAGRTYVSAEKVIAQQPDVVLAENITSPETISTLRDAGITVYHFNTSNSIQDVYDKVAMTGQLVGECDAATETVREMKTELAIVEEATEGQERTDFLYALYGFTAGENTFIHDALTTAGGNNLAVDEVDFPPSGFAEINPETVADLEVEWLVYPGTEAAIPNNAAYSETIAQQEGNLLALDNNQISQPAPRIVLAARQAAQTWYPDAYASANESLRGNVDVEANLYSSTDVETTTQPTTTTDSGTTAMTTDESTETTADDSESTETTAEATTTESTGGSPGFGPVAALLAGALIVATALARRD